MVTVEAGLGVTVEDAAEKSSFKTVAQTSRGAKSRDFLLCFSSPAAGRAGGEVKFMGEIAWFWEIFCLACIVEFYFLFLAADEGNGNTNSLAGGVLVQNQPGQCEAAFLGTENTRKRTGFSLFSFLSLSVPALSWLLGCC